MTQNIVVQIGQCGNQIGYQFWDAALKEHTSLGKNALSDESFSSFFDIADEEKERGGLKARAVLIDMEEGVVNEIMKKSPIASVFNNKQFITDQSGAGNNWAVGHLEYGKQYRDVISNVIRKTAEKCDCLTCFFCIHSMGGGTGSGLGTFVLQLLEDEYPDVFRFVTAVYPSADDDVITSAYNSTLAMHMLTECADCVVPIENQALINIVNRVESSTNKLKNGERTSTDARADAKRSRPFDSMNNIVANLLLNLTSSSRFEGSLNVDLNEISTNLVPYRKLHYLTSSMTPLYSLANSKVSMRNLNEMFTDAFSKDHQVLQVDPKHGLYLACALIVRGKVEISDIRRNIDRLIPSLNFVHWNRDGWKTGLCSVPPVNQQRALLSLANNTCMLHTCLDIRNRCMKLYKRKAHLHHYLNVEGFDDLMFADSIESLDWLISEYEDLEATVKERPPYVERLQLA